MCKEGHLTNCKSMRDRVERSEARRLRRRSIVPAAVSSSFSATPMGLDSLALTCTHHMRPLNTDLEGTLSE